MSEETKEPLTGFYDWDITIKPLFQQRFSLFRNWR